MPDDLNAKPACNTVQIRLNPGDEFRIGQDGRAVVARDNGAMEELHQSDGRSIIHIMV
nr:hypothetical protein [uncultured Dyadobacter sp.]